MRPQTVTDEEILSVARKVFLENGPQASVEMIAKELGLSQPALFKRFGTKRNLMIKSLQPPKETEWFKIVDNGPDERPFPEQLSEVMEGIGQILKNIQPVMQIVQMTDITPRELMSGMDEPPPVKGLRKLSAWLKRCHEKHLIREVDYRQAAITIMGSIQFNTLTKTFISEKNNESDSLGSEDFIKELSDLIYRGLKKD